MEQEGQFPAQIVAHGFDARLIGHEQRVLHQVLGWSGLVAAKLGGQFEAMGGEQPGQAVQVVLFFEDLAKRYLHLNGQDIGQQSLRALQDGRVVVGAVQDHPVDFSQSGQIVQPHRGNGLGAQDGCALSQGGLLPSGGQGGQRAAIGAVLAQIECGGRAVPEGDVMVVMLYQPAP